MLDFFSTECPPCEALAPKFEAVAEQFAGKARFLLVSGDNRGSAQAVAAALGIDEVRAEVLPQDKAALVAARRHDGSVVAMVAMASWRSWPAASVPQA